MTDLRGGNRGVILDPKVWGVLDRLHRAARGDLLKFGRVGAVMGLTRLLGRRMEAATQASLFKDVYIPVNRDQGQLLYLLARSIGARRIVEFGTSFGISTLYLAAAVRDGGGGRVIGTELEPTKHARAVQNLADAGLSDVAEVRLGDARETLQDVAAPVDLLLLDGWKDLYLPILHLIQPKLRRGALVLADNIFTFKTGLRPYVEHMQAGGSGFRSATLHISDGFEMSLYVGEAG
ncbi:MAG TPA: class I SAM-dependent methyltransferase [Myxococcales bacterium]|nr:class I SAM-dependent methyltransferase [Myxococcales bacterium]